MKSFLVAPEYRLTRLVAVAMVAALAGGCSSSSTSTDDTDNQTLIGDSNGDGVVDVLDGDYNNDGLVNSDDLDFNLDTYVDTDDDINGDGDNTSADFDINNDGLVTIDDDINEDGQINILDVDPDATGGGGDLGPCNGHGGSDPISANANWDDNCTISSANSFSVSSYTRGIQRILFCRGHSVATSIEVFADGDFGTLTAEAVREFQTAEGLIIDGVVGEDTWARLQSVLERIATTSTQDTWAVDSVACADQSQFFQEIDGITEAGWSMATTPGSDTSTEFSIN